MPIPAPTQLTVTPASGTIFGGTPISITGTNFVATPTVTIGGIACTDVVFVSSSLLHCTTPQGLSLGPAALVVRNPDGQTCTAPLDYVYLSGTWGVHRIDLKPRTEQTS